MNTVDRVISLVVTTLEIEDRKDTFTADTPLLGAVPELDSLMVMMLLVGIEGEFGVTIADDEVDGEMFETVGSLASVVENKL